MEKEAYRRERGRVRVFSFSNPPPLLSFPTKEKGGFLISITFFLNLDRCFLIPAPRNEFGPGKKK